MTRAALALDDARLQDVAQTMNERLHGAISERVALECDRARELDALQRLHEVSSYFLRAGAVTTVLGELLDAAIAISGADVGNIQLLDRRSSDLVIAAQRGFPDWWVAYWDRAATGRGACGTALERREPVIVEDILASPIFGAEAREVQLAAGVRAVQSTPLLGRDGAPLGMISTHYRTPHRPGESVQRLLALLARQAAELIERTRADEELRASEERYRTLFESIDQGFCVIEVLFDGARTVDYRFVEANAVFEAHTGIAHPVGRLVSELVPDLEEHWLELYGHVARTGEARRYANWAATLGRFYEVYAFRLGPPEARQVAALFSDVTERKRIEEARQILADIGPMLASNLLDYEGTLTRVADIAARQLGDFSIVDLFEGGEVRRLRVAGRDPAMAPVCQRLQQLPLRSGRPYLARHALETRKPVLRERLSSEELAALAPNEEHLEALRAAQPRSLMAVPLLARDNLLGAFVLLSSSRHYGQADLDLAQEIARRAALAVDNARLYGAAERAVQARDEVLGVVAHDLRNPLNTIVLHAALLGAPGTPPERRSQRHVEGIERAAKRMERLIQDLLEITRLESGSLSLDRTRISAAQVIADFVEAEKSLASSAPVELRVEAAPDLGEVFADRDRLLQVLENLVGNARRFTREGGHVTIGAAPMGEDIWFRVTDTGPGITDEDLPHLFDRFWQAKKNRKLGAGLGLPIVKGIVNAHGGRVWVDSQVGVGSTFYFSIPLARTSDRDRRR